MKVYCKDCRRYKFSRLFKIKGCKIDGKWFFVGLNRYKECAYYCEEEEWVKAACKAFKWFFKVCGFLFCIMSGQALEKWSYNGEPESGWLLWQPFLFLAFSIGCFMLSKFYSKKVKEAGNANNK